MYSAEIRNRIKGALRPGAHTAQYCCVLCCPTTFCRDIGVGVRVSAMRQIDGEIT